MAAYSVLILQVLLPLLLLLRVLLQASVTRCCKQALLAPAWCCCCKRAHHRRQGSDLRSYDAIFITVQPCLGRCCGVKTALLAWWLWRYEDYRMPSRFGQREFGTRALSDLFISFAVLLARGRRGQRKNEGSESSGCRAAHKIDRTSACWCFLLLVASAACCCGMPRLLLLLLLLQVDPAAARLWPSCK